MKSRLSHVLEYAKNTEKTENPKWSETDYQTMRDVMDYAMNDYKTEKQYYVTAINCNLDCAREQMQMAKTQFSKNDGILAWHGYQSFAEGEVDADTAHEIGVRLAKELWPEFQVIVATHLNTRCLHNHFVLNSVSFLHGGKFNACKESYRKMRAVSDRLCKEYKLSIIKEHTAYYPKHYAEWAAREKGNPTWRDVIREDVDAAVMGSVSFQSFVNNLRERGYEVEKRGSFWRVRPQGKERFVRLRSLGENYTEEAITERIIKQRWPTRPPKPKRQESTVRIKIYGDFHLSKITWKGLRALYYFYRRKLREARGQQSSYTPYILRDDIRRLDAIDKQTRFLFTRKIDTEQQLSAYQSNAEKRIASLSDERTDLKNELRRTNIPEKRTSEIQLRLQQIASELKLMRQDVKLCKAILVRSLEIAEKNAQLKQNKEKEVERKQAQKHKSSVIHIR